MCALQVNTNTECIPTTVKWSLEWGGGGMRLTRKGHLPWPGIER